MLGGKIRVIKTEICIFYIELFLLAGNRNFIRFANPLFNFGSATFSLVRIVSIFDLLVLDP